MISSKSVYCFILFIIFFFLETNSNAIVKDKLNKQSQNLKSNGALSTISAIGFQSFE